MLTEENLVRIAPLKFRLDPVTRPRFFRARVADGTNFTLPKVAVSEATFTIYNFVAQRASVL